MCRSWPLRLRRDGLHSNDNRFRNHHLPSWLRPGRVPKTLGVPRAVADAPANLPGTSATGEMPPGTLPSGAAPIDLANALGLGGASHLEVALARQRVVQAHADWVQARLALLPTLRFGLGWNKHEGRLQRTDGTVVQAGRNSLYVGGGAGLGDAPLTGGSSGPIRFMMNLSLADALYAPPAGHARLHAATADVRATGNHALLDISLAYGRLVENHALLANAREGLASAQETHRLAKLLANDGLASQADVYGAAGERSYWQQQLMERQRQAAAASIELARLIRLPAGSTLQPAEDFIVPVELVLEETSVEQLVQTGLSTRPELAQHRWLVDASIHDLRRACMRPWLPYIQLGAAGGVFGGGPSGQFNNQGGRSDIDILAIWELRHLGLGHKNERRMRVSQQRTARLNVEKARDRIVAEVLSAAGDVASYRRQMQVAQEAVEFSEKSYVATLDRVREAVAPPLDLFPVTRTRGQAKDAYARSIGHYNAAQFRLQHALGRPIVAKN